MAITTDYAYRFPDLPTVIPINPTAVSELREQIAKLTTSRISNPCVEIILPEKEPTMKPLFQFTTIKPDAEVIWNTLSTHEITAVSGYTADAIRFYMFVILQLREDLKSAKELCNNYESRTSELHTAVRDLLNIIQMPNSLRVPPVDLPQWVGGLYTPYYMLKQLNIEATSGLWFTLFDRTNDSPMSHLELESLWADTAPISESITAYKLWYYGNDIITEKYSDIFEIVNTDGCIPLPINDKAELILELNQHVHDNLTDSDSHIYDYSHKLSIPPFILGVSDAPQ